MPIIAVEEDDLDEVTRLLSGVAVPDVKSSATISIHTPPTEDAKEDDRIPIDDDGVESVSSTFELCSIPSCANLSEYNNDYYDNDFDNLSASIRSKGSIDRSSRSIDRSGRSIGSSQRYKIVRRVPSASEMLNRSIGRSSTRRNGRGINNLNRSMHSTGTKQLDEIIVLPKTESIDSKYFVDYSREIGRGTKTIVRKCTERSTGKRYAVKSVRRTDKIEYDHMRNEANLLTALNHPGIIQIYDTYEDDKYLHMVVDICKGGEIYDYVVKPATTKKKGGPTEVPNCPCEEVAAVIVRRVVDAVAYLHDHDIVHRDLKLENLLFKSKPNAKDKKSLTEIRVIDFGLSRRYNTHHRFASLPKLTSFVGTKIYVAPEVLNHSYTHAVDLWSIGVLAYALLSARAPFTGRDDQELFDKIQHCGEELKFPSPDFDGISNEARDFIRRLLVKDAATRPSAREMLNHPWMVKAIGWKNEINASADEKSSVLKKLFGRLGKGKKKPK